VPFDPATLSIAAWIAAVSSVFASPFAPVSVTLTRTEASGGGSQDSGASEAAIAGDMNNAEMAKWRITERTSFLRLGF
jgi:hypothetical protein